MSARRALARLLVVAVLAFGAFRAPAARAQDEAGRHPIPEFTGNVVDQAELFPEARQAQLEGFLDQLKQKTGAQFAVLTVPDCAPEVPEAYKTRVFQAWKIGDRERDDGLLLLVAMQEHAIVFETGYGLEGTLPDGWQARMIRDLAIPRFRAGEPAEGVLAAVLAASQRIAAEKGVKLEWDGRELTYDEPRDPRGLSRLFPVILFLLLFVVFPMLRSGRRGRRGWYWGSGGFGGGWGGGFGGFGGGFGGGGGGFGGGGGGASGGGGGGGRW